jgi:hypothetical protein
MKPILVDAHQDLAYNMIEFGRDYTALPWKPARSRSLRDSQPQWRQHAGLARIPAGTVAIVFPLCS